MDWKQYLDMNKYFDLYRLISLIFLIVVGINAGLYGLTNHEFIMSVLGNIIGRLVFIIAGLGAAFMCYALYLEKFKKKA